MLGLEPRTVWHIAAIMTTIACALATLASQLERGPKAGTWFPPPSNPAKAATERWFLAYGAVWISVFAVVIGLQLYTLFDRPHYLALCGGLALPLLLQPVLAPSLTGDSGKPLIERYSFKANLWIAIFGFIGNYWYTHYFYSVLKADYTMPSWDLNGVPIPMYFATHFYFTFYHTLSNCALRKVYSTYRPCTTRTLFVVTLVLAMSYITAFMETFTISGFPCYGFEDRHLVYTLGSAFYALYFVVSFPMFYRMDEDAEAPPHTAFQTTVEALASGMAVLCLLDFVRVALGQDLTISLNRRCRLDPSLTCAPFTHC